MRPRAALLLSVPAVLACVAGAIAASWQLPATTLSVAGRASDSPGVVIDATGVATAAWAPASGDAGAIQASRFVNGEWTAPQDISGSDAETLYPVLAVDAAGAVTAAWTRREGAGYVVQAARYAGGEWGPAHDLSSVGSAATYPSVAVDPSGVVTAVWQRAAGGNVVVESSRFAGATWTSPVTVGTGSTGLVMNAHPQVAVDGSGVATATWMQSSAGQIVISASRFSAGAWSAPQSISPVGANEFGWHPQLAAASSGDVTVVWYQSVPGGYEIRFARFTAGAWGASAVIPGSPDSGAAYPAVAVDASGIVTAAWYRGSTGANEVVASRFSGGAWSAVQQLSAAGLDAFMPTVAVDPSGSVMATWQQATGAGEYFVAAARHETGTWGTAQVVSPSGGTNRYPTVALDARGNAVVAWGGYVDGVASVQAAQFFTTPSPPRSAAATPGDGSVEVTWTAPANDAGSPITGYEVTMTPGDRTCTTTAPTTRCTFSGLANGTAYSFSITAANALGTSWASTVTAMPRVPASGGSGAGGGASTAPLTAPLTAIITTSRRTVASGKRITASIRVRNTGTATATKVVACIKAPKGLSIVQKPGAKKRLRNPACFTVKTLPVGTQVTRKVTLQASASRKVTRSVTGTARAKGIAKVKATPRKVAITVAR